MSFRDSLCGGSRQFYTRTDSSFQRPRKFPNLKHARRKNEPQEHREGSREGAKDLEKAALQSGRVLRRRKEDIPSRPNAPKKVRSLSTHNFGFPNHPETKEISEMRDRNHFLVLVVRDNCKSGDPRIQNNSLLKNCRLALQSKPSPPPSM